MAYVPICMLLLQVATDVYAGTYYLTLSTERIRLMVTYANGSTQLIPTVGTFALSVKYNGDRVAINGSSSITITQAAPVPAPAPADISAALAYDPVDTSTSSVYASPVTLVAAEAGSIVIEPRDQQGSPLQWLLAPERFSLHMYHASDLHQEDRLIMAPYYPQTFNSTDYTIRHDRPCHVVVPCCKSAPLSPLCRMPCFLPASLHVP